MTNQTSEQIARDEINRLLKYVFFIDKQAIGVIEAKPESWGEKITIVEEQSAGYAHATLKWVNNSQPLRFIYKSTGVITRFTDTLDPNPRSREVFNFHQPETLAKWIRDSKSLLRKQIEIAAKSTSGVNNINSRELQNLIIPLPSIAEQHELLLHLNALTPSVNNDGVCPFCQQDTSDDFAKSLVEYFDETFEADSKAIDDLKVNYESEAAKLQKGINNIISKPSRFLNLDKLKSGKQLLDSTIAGNLQKLENKKKEPSQLVELDSIVNIIKEIEMLINEANTNITQERKTLTEQVWKFILGKLNADLSDYRNKKSNLDSAITSLKKQIEKKELEKNQKAQEIIRLEKQTTSIQPTINDINKMLESFGFQGFSLAPVDNQHYKLIRANGEDAKTTLSEGERTFVTFLYFYHLLKGSSSKTGITANRVVVFDDPVSSLDSDILFIVSSLIKGLFDDVRDENSYIKQIFVLTHNVYFHREVSFNNKRPSDRALSEETFWITRKDGQLSKIIRHNSNPIKNSYELLWVDVKDQRNPNLTIQNTLRRILEHYFKILGGINLDDICKQFDGKNKLICNSLLSWVHDGSHSVHDDLYVSNGDTTVETYLRIFKEIFEKAGHIAHYNMMMVKDSDVEET